MRATMREVPPPDVVPIDATAEALGLCRGIKVEKSSSQFRCSNCNKMQPGGSLFAWVADGVKIGDYRWSIEENERLNAYNGHGSGWCLRCVQRLCGAPKSRITRPVRRWPWWRFW